MRIGLQDSTQNGDNNTGAPPTNARSGELGGGDLGAIDVRARWSGEFAPAEEARPEQLNRRVLALLPGPQLGRRRNLVNWCSKCIRLSIEMLCKLAALCWI